MRLGWREDVLRQKFCFDSRKRRNASSTKFTKRRKRRSGKDWRKRHAKNRKRKRHGGEKKIASLPWNNNSARIG